MTGRGAPASAAGPSAGRTGVTVAGTVPGFVRVTDAILRKPNPADWLMIRRDYSATSYSPLTQITAANASKLELAWMWPMREGGTNQPAPLVYNGTMYLANTGGIVQALNARTGQLIWEHAVGAEVAPRGLALYGNLLIFHSAAAWALNRQDAYLIALDARTGETAWKVLMPDVYASNSGPIIANGLIVQGMGTCQIYEEKKCFISAYDPETGRAALAIQHDRAERRAGRRDVGHAAGSLSCRRGDVDYGELRPRAESHLLGHHAGQAVDASQPRHGD